jgi:FtsP/CotA-like multicopper oxidase with cupredoxin domain
MERRHLLMTGLGTMFLMAAAPLIGWSAGEASSASRVRETFREPPVWRSEGGALQRSLEIRRAKTRLGRRQILTLTYEGAIPGPTWLLEPGDHIKVRLINNMTPSASASSEPILPHAPHDHAAGGGGAEMETAPSLLTNIHVHGLQVDPRGNRRTGSTSRSRKSVRTSSWPRATASRS